MRDDKVKVVLEVRKEPNVTYIEGYNGTLLDPNKVGEEEAGDPNDDDDDNDDRKTDGLTEMKDLDNYAVVSQEENLAANVVVGDDDSAVFVGGQESSNSDSLSSLSSSSELAPQNSRSKTSNSGSSSSSVSKKSKKKKSLELSLTCTTENAKPPVTHKWSKIIGDKKEKLTPVTSQIIQVDEITGVTTTKSTVRLNLSSRDKVGRRKRRRKRGEFNYRIVPNMRPCPNKRPPPFSAFSILLYLFP